MLVTTNTGYAESSGSVATVFFVVSAESFHRIQWSYPFNVAGIGVTSAAETSGCVILVYCALTFGAGSAQFIAAIGIGARACEFQSP